jgi:P-type E1-E2 ATPase
MNKVWWIVGGTAFLSAICGSIADGWQGFEQGIVIIVAGLFIILISSWADLVKDKRFIQLQSLLKEDEVGIIRGKFGSTHTYSVWDLVVGDIILLNTGDRVPADCLIVESNGLEAEESRDDETRRVRKSSASYTKENTDCFLFADSFIVKGTCKAVVCCVGTASSRAAEDVLNTDIDTPLQTKMQNLTTHFTKYAIYSSVVIFILNITIMIISVSNAEENGTRIFFSKITRNINYAVILWMTSVPEGLPLAIGMSLAFSVMKMYKDKVLIKKLDAPEKLGCIEEICCGKTGTITSGYMKVTQFHCDRDNNEIIKASRKNTFLNCELSQMALNLVQESILYNCDARVEMEHLTYEATGNATECAFLRFLQDAEIPVHL